MRCPHCNAADLQKSSNKIYVCPNCEIVFTEWELVENWGWDIADLHELDIVSNMGFTFEPTFEPDWITKQERNDAYQMVHRMFMGISELDYNPLLDLPFPIGAVGTC
jgi:transcription initiation factor TFIIIB Brf1 subunit/transcription initiation factor TFIIB